MFDLLVTLNAELRERACVGDDIELATRKDGPTADGDRDPERGADPDGGGPDAGWDSAAERSESLVAEIVELERTKAMLEARVMLLIGDLANHADGWLHLPDARIEDRLGGDSLAAAELAPALHLAPVTAGMRVERALRMRDRLPLTLQTLALGELDLGRVLAIDEATRPLTLDQAARVERMVLPKAVDQTAAELRAALRKAVIAVDPNGAEERRKGAVKDRRVNHYQRDDGMSAFEAVLSAIDSGEIYDLVDEVVRRTKTTHDTRSMDARRADAFVWLVLGRDPHLGPQDDEPDNDEPPRPATPTECTDPATNPGDEFHGHPDDPADPGDPPAAPGDGFADEPDDPSSPPAAQDEPNESEDCHDQNDLNERGDLDRPERGDDLDGRFPPEPADHDDSHAPTGEQHADNASDTQPTDHPSGADPSSADRSGAFQLTAAQARDGDLHGYDYDGEAERDWAEQYAREDDEHGWSQWPDAVELALRDTELNRIDRKRDARTARLSELATLALSAMTSRRPQRLRWVALNLVTRPDRSTILVGELEGYGPITADAAQHLLAVGAARPPDPPSGQQPTAAQADTHDPPGWLDRDIRARDGTCRYPGCRQTARRGDLDHTIAFPRGLTVPGNLGALCRRHHRVKHAGTWRVTQDADTSTYTWTSTITGRAYVTQPRGTTGDWTGATTQKDGKD